MTSLLHGVDLVSVERLKGILQRTPAFSERVFSEAERAYCEAQAEPTIHFAARFAAKEAAIKALGLGLTSVGIDGLLRMIHVERDQGPPRLVLEGRAAERARELGVAETALSLTHTDDHALASVVMTTAGAERSGS